MQVVDPVCGMSIDSEKAATKEYEGRVYYFCSQGCLNKFNLDPRKYIRD